MSVSTTRDKRDYSTIEATGSTMSSELSGAMRNHSFKYPPYIAISHRWAAPGNEEIILIDGAPFLVSPNIYNLLVAKRSTFRHVILWIDSICIDQRNSKEKGRQVGMMRRIFEEASCTIGWLGDE